MFSVKSSYHCQLSIFLRLMACIATWHNAKYFRCTWNKYSTWMCTAHSSEFSISDEFFFLRNKFSVYLQRYSAPTYMPISYQSELLCQLLVTFTFGICIQSRDMWAFFCCVEILTGKLSRWLWNLSGVYLLI